MEFVETIKHEHPGNTKNTHIQSLTEKEMKVAPAAMGTGTYPNAAALQNQNIYDTYLLRLNDNIDFSKALKQQKILNSVKDNAKDSTAQVDSTVEKPPSVSRQPLTDSERERIRERYSEKVKERRLRMYEKAILLAEEREREEGKRYRSQRQLHFQITYKTYFGQNLAVVGSTAPLGCWDTEKAIPLTWCPDNMWTGTVTLSVEDGIVEYKYIVKDCHTGAIVWEPGFNHKIDSSKLSAASTINNTWGCGDELHN